MVSEAQLLNSVIQSNTLEIPDTALTLEGINVFHFSPKSQERP